MVRQAAVRAAVRAARELEVGRVLVGLVLGSALALGYAVWLARVRLEVGVAGSIVALCLMTALLTLSTWDLVVRWRQITSVPVPVVTAWSPPRRMLRHVWPGLVLVLGIAVGHWFW
jgi:hypothetical protein